MIKSPKRKLLNSLASLSFYNKSAELQSVFAALEKRSAKDFNDDMKLSLLIWNDVIGACSDDTVWKIVTDTNNEPLKQLCQSIKDEEFHPKHRNLR